MQPLNYCRQFVMQAMDVLAHPMVERDLADRCRSYIDLAKASEKFILPLSGRLIDDKELRALDDSEPLNLPYEFIALEIPQGAPSDGRDETVFRVRKSIVFARAHGEDIMINAAYFNEANGIWISMSYTIGVPRQNYLLRKHEDGLPGIRISFPADIDDEAKPFAAATAWALISLLNALACSNVATERISSAKSGRSPKGALAFDEYHVLTIPTVGMRSEGVGGTHRSPREHLRRGHIRRYESGLKIWVNATVINAGVGGKVSKDYRIAA